MTDTNTQAKTWLKPAQVQRLRDAAHADGTLQYLRDRNDTIVAVLYDTGLRVAELVALDVDDVRLADREIYLPAHKQKDYPTDRSPRAKPIALAQDDATADTVRRLRSYLSGRWKESPALFPSRQSDRMTTESVRRVVRTLAERADVEPYRAEGGRGDPSDVTPHTLRHSVAYRLLHEEEGYTMYDARNRLRHATILTTERVYDHFERI
jgi:integrase/recombinase XerC/integrase/recombinase XerD